MKNIFIGAAIATGLMFSFPAVASVVTSLQIVSSVDVPNSLISVNPQVTKILDTDTNTVCYTYSRGGISCVKR